MKRLKICFAVALLAMAAKTAFCFDSGAVLGLKALFSGSATDPHIGDADMKTMGAEFLKGGVGFVMSGEFDFTYIFDAPTYFKLANTKVFGGLGFQTFLGVGQGFAAEVSGITGASVFMNVSYTPVVTFGLGVKSYFLSNRLVVGFGLGTRIIADPTPSYDMYNSAPETLPTIDGVGTMIITDDMMKKMNAFGFLTKLSMEYVQPIINTTELVLGGYMSYCVYKPGYITMPPALEKVAKDAGFDARNTPLKTFFLNSLDFGLMLGFNFRVNP